MKEYVESLVCSIVDDTDNILIEEVIINFEETSLYKYIVTVSKDDVGKLIGKNGRIASAIRAVLKAAGAKKGIKVSINIMNTPLDVQ